MSKDFTVVIDQLIEIRRKKGLTQTELAELLHLPQSNIGRLESKKHAPQLDTLIKVAAALDCEVAIVPKS